MLTRGLRKHLPTLMRLRRSADSAIAVMKGSQDARCWSRLAQDLWMPRAWKTGGSSCASRNFYGGKSIPKLARNKKSSGSNCIAHNGRNTSRDKEMEGSGDGVELCAQVSSRELGERDALVDELHDVLCGSAGKKDFGDAGLFEGGDVGFGNDAADEDGDGIHAFVVAELHQLGADGVVRAREDG